MLSQFLCPHCDTNVHRKEYVNHLAAIHRLTHAECPVCCKRAKINDHFKSHVINCERIDSSSSDSSAEMQTEPVSIPDISFEMELDEDGFESQPLGFDENGILSKIKGIFHLFFNISFN